jgi:hypothetical protein
MSQIIIAAMIAAIKASAVRVVALEESGAAVRIELTTSPLPRDRQIIKSMS